MLRRLSHPLITLFLALLLFFDAFHLPSGPLGSRIGTRFARQNYIGATATGGGPSAVLILAPGGAWSVHPREQFILDPLLRRDAAASPTILFAEFREAQWSRGFWAITSRGYNLGAYIYEPVSAPRADAATRDSARAAFLKWLVETQSLPPADAINLRPGNIRHSEAVWLGRGHSFAALLIALALVRSLGWVPRLIDRLTRDHSREALIARGLCPNCRYSIRGLTSGICPECGGDLSPTDSEGATLKSS